MKSKSFETALITGASRGIGEALAYLLAEKGISLILVARSTDHLQALAKKLSPLVPVEVISCDLAHSEEVAKLVKVVHSKRPDLIINNAGFGLYGDILNQSTRELLEMVDVNIKALMELTIEGARALTEGKKQGVILNVSSVAGELKIFPAFSVYAASKSFVTRFSESFDFEVAPLGVRVLTSCPGMVNTHFRYRASGDKLQKSSGRSMSVEFAAKEIWRQIQSRKRVHVFDLKYRWAVGLSRWIPKLLLAKGMRRGIQARISSSSSS